MFLLVNNVAIWEKSHCFAPSEFEQDVLIRYKEHLLNLMQLLKAYDAKFAYTRRWLDHKTELILLVWPLVYHFSGHLNAFNTWNFPVFLILYLILLELFDGILETPIRFVKWLAEVFIWVFLFLAKVVIW